MRRRIRGLGPTVLAVFGLFLARLFQMQVVEGERYAREARLRRTEAEWISAPRGRILDRTGIVLAETVVSYSCRVVLPDLDPCIHLAYRTSRVLLIPRQALDARLAELEDRAQRDARKFLPLVTHIPAQKAARMRLLVLSYAGKLRIEPEGSAFRLSASRDLILARYLVVVKLAALLGEPGPEGLLQRLDDLRKEALSADSLVLRRDRLSRQHTLVDDLSFDQAARVAEAQPDLPGVSLGLEYARRHPQGDLACHVLGYTGAPSPSDLERFRADRRLLPARAPSDPEPIRDGGRLLEDPVGRTGIEARFDDRLAGRPGMRLAVREIGAPREWLVAAQPGADVRLTLDASVQAKGEIALDAALRAYEGATGAACVLLCVRSGAVLALCSAPRYDPDTLADRYREMASSNPSPLPHRAVQSAVPPGSTQKLVTALIGLSAVPSGHPPVTVATKLLCTGQMGKGSFRCHVYPGAHGLLDVVSALEVSCNHYFYKLGQSLGPEILIGGSVMLGLGRPTGVGLPGEGRGFVPTPGWKHARYEDARQTWRRAVDALAEAPADPRRAKALEEAASKLERFHADREWWGGDSRNMGIGQGGLLTTPLQVARMAAVVGSGGYLVTPHLVVGDAQPPVLLPISREAVEATREGMRRAVHAPRGTASRRALGLRRFGTAAKTGTAQAGRGGDHAWICGYAPHDAPEVAFAVLIEHAGTHGADAAGPVAAALLDAWFERASEGGTR